MTPVLQKGDYIQVAIPVAADKYLSAEEMGQQMQEAAEKLNSFYSQWDIKVVVISANSTLDRVTIVSVIRE